MSEKLLQDALARWLTDQGIPFFRQRMDARTTGTVGWPDYTVVHNGRVLLLELKMPKTGRLSTAQVFKHAELAKAGCHVFVIKDLDAACATVVEWLAQGANLTAPVTGKLIQVYGKQWQETPSGYVPVKP